MSALYGSMSGERGTVTKCGLHTLSAHLCGWTSGILVTATHDQNKEDSFFLWRTGGSGDSTPKELIGIVKNGVFILNTQEEKEPKE